jgi:hypothetical protein
MILRRQRWLKLARAADAGRFAVEGLPPGEFWVAAVDRVPGDEQEGEWQTPAALGSLVPGAQRVRVSEGEPAAMTLRLVSGQW